MFTKRQKTWIYGFVFIFIVALILGYVLKLGDNYWDNLWNFAAGFLGVIGAVTIFLWESDKDNQQSRIDRYMEFQDDFLRNQAINTVPFDRNLRSPEEETKEDKIALAQMLISLLYSLKDGEERQQQISDLNIEENANLSDLKTNVDIIVREPKNADILDIIRNNNPDLKATIDEYIQRIQESNSNKNDIILGSWMMNKKRAQQAKYLIGLPTINEF